MQNNALVILHKNTYQNLYKIILRNFAKGIDKCSHWVYNIHITKERRRCIPLGKKKTNNGRNKNGNKNVSPEKTIILVTAIVNLVTAFLLLIEKFTS